MRERHVEPDADPIARCGNGHSYNPYKHGLDCPHCKANKPNAA